MAKKDMAAIAFDLELNDKELKTAVRDVTEDIKKEFEKGFKDSLKTSEEAASGIRKELEKISSSAKKEADKAGDSIKEKAKKTADDIKKETSQIGDEIKETAGETEDAVQKILSDSEKSMKAKAASIAAIYKKEGMSSSDAMKKAWDQIERDTYSGSKKAAKHVKSFGGNFDSLKKKADRTSEGIKTSFTGIGSTVKKIGLGMAAVFGFHELVDFGKECLELGSDLAEVQNVVDVTFPNMTKEIDAFAKSAASNFGLSETMAKKFAGTFGSMAEAFGFSEKQAAKMATELTGLSGDVASFYNISQDEAYTKLKSVFTGETESLKDLGVVMTQTALEEFAMNEGMGESIAKMSEAEKVALRLAFVQDKLSNADGDFARTSESWANQTRILSLQFDSLKASLGQGFINVFTPIIRQINALMAKLVELAGAFKSFTEMLMGGSSSGEVDDTAKAAAAAKKELAGAAGEADSLAASTEKSGKAAKKAAKEMLGLMGFDELNNASSGKEETSSGKTDTGGLLGDFDLKPADQGKNTLDELGKLIQGAVDKLKELQKAFKKGFHIGLGDTEEVFKSIEDSIASVKKSLGKIFENEKLQKAADDFEIIFMESLGTMAGSAASIGLTIIDNFIGGMAMYLEQHAGDIRRDLTEMFDVGADLSIVIADICSSIADIFEVFRGEDAKQITADIINIFSDSFTNIALLTLKFGKDVLENLAKPITDNTDQWKEALENTLKPIRKVVSGVSDVFSDTWDTIQSVYDSNVKPLLDSIGSGISEWTETLLDGYSTYIAPVLDVLADKFKDVLEEHIQPAIDKVIKAFGSLCGLVQTLWEKALQPLVNWIIANVMPILADFIEKKGKAIINLFGDIGDVIGGLADIFGGACDTLKSLIEGDWDTVWESLKKTAEGVKDAIVGTVKSAIDKIKFMLSPTLIESFFNKIWDSIKGAFSGVKEWFGNLFAKAFKKIKSAFSGIKKFFAGVWEDIKAGLPYVPDYFKDLFERAYKKITGAFSGVKKYFADMWSDIKEPFKTVAEWFEDKFSAAWKKVKDVFSAGGEIFAGIKEGIENTFKTIVNKLISGINIIIKKPFEKINDMLNTIHDVSVAGVKPFSKLWKKNPLSVPSIPALAQGGYVKANTPRLAMIGDNTMYGEIVSPENKLQEMADKAVSKSHANTVNALVPVIERLCNAIIELENSGGNSGLSLEKYKEGDLLKVVRAENEKYKKRNGGKSALR